MRSLLFAMAVAALFASPADAAVRLWDGGGSNDDMSTAQNWALDVAPASNDILQFVGPNRPTPYTLTMRFLQEIEFPLDGNATSFTLSGARLHMKASGIHNWSGRTQTIGNPISLDGGAVDHTFRGESGVLVVNGDMSLASGRAVVVGPGEVQFNGEVSATSGSIDVGTTGFGGEAGNLALGGTVNVDVDVRAGHLVIDTDQPQPDYTTLQFQDGTSFESRGPHSITQNLQLTGDVTFTGNGSLISESSVSGSGNLIVDAGVGVALDLGSTNHLSPFNGDATVLQGTLRLYGDGLLAQVAGDVDVGSPAGGDHWAQLRAPFAGQVGQGRDLTVRTTGLVILRGARTFSNLSLLGGDLEVDDTVSVPTIFTGGSTRTASLNAPWSIPAQPALYSIFSTDGAASPDLRFLQGTPGGGRIQLDGSGEIEFRGVAADGPAGLTVGGPTVILNRTGTSSAMDYLFVGGASLVQTVSSAQLAEWTEIDLGPASVLDIGVNQELGAAMTMEDAQVTGTGVLTLHDDLTSLGDNLIETTLSFGVPLVGIDIEAGGTLTTGMIDGTAVYQFGGGVLEPEEINCDFSVNQGSLRFAGFCDGDLTVADTLVLLRDQGAIQVNGTLMCGANSVLSVQLDLSGAVAGDSWVLLSTAAGFDGGFGTVNLPAPPAGHFLFVEYLGSDLVLRLEAIDNAVLDFKDGVNGQQGFLGEGLNGVASVSFTPQGFDDLQVCSITVDSLRSPLGDSSVAIRLYDVNTGFLIAASQKFFAQTDDYRSVTFAVDALLQPLNEHKLVVYGAGDLVYQAYDPNRGFPYFQSTLVEINGAHRDRPAGDVVPVTPTDGFPQFSLELGPCNLTAAPPVAPERFELALAASPNPFNPQTMVSFEIPSEGGVDVSVFDARGRRVATLFDDHRPAGRFDLQWRGVDSNGRTLGSGVYFLKLSHASGVKVRRVTLLK